MPCWTGLSHAAPGIFPRGQDINRWREFGVLVFTGEHNCCTTLHSKCPHQHSSQERQYKVYISLYSNFPPKLNRREMAMDLDQGSIPVVPVPAQYLPPTATKARQEHVPPQDAKVQVESAYRAAPWHGGGKIHPVGPKADCNHPSSAPGHVFLHRVHD